MHRRKNNKFLGSNKENCRKICKLWEQWVFDESNAFCQFDKKIVYKKCD